MFDLLEQFLNAVPCSFVTTNEVGEIIFINDSALDLFGHKKNELVGNNVKLLMPESIANSHDQYLKTYIETRKANIIGKSRHVPAKKKDGTLFQVELFLGEFKVNEAQFFVGMIYDEQHQIDLFKTINGTLQHEIKTPLSIILENLDLLRRRNGTCREIDDAVTGVKRIVQVLKNIETLEELIKENYDSINQVIKISD
jgi:PAS domain S-box-containing protein